MKKKISIIIFIIVIIGIVLLSTVALWNWSSGNTNVGFTINGLDAYIIYNKGSDVLTGVLDSCADYSDSSISAEITLYKNTSKTLYGHIFLDITAIGTNIKEEDAVKWAITSNGKILSEGDFIGSSVGTSIPLKMNIPLSTDEQKFQIYIWLDENMDINEAMEGEILSTKVRTEASEFEYEIEPNKPALVEGLIPITYSDNKWVKANSKNTDYNWYNYKEKRWANAVLVSSDYRNSDGTDKFNIEDEVPEDAILAYYVWIPRYKYRVWNINKQVGVDSYDAYNKGIDIRFEKEKETTGTISCEYDFSVLEGEGLSEICSGNNGEYYTHPAFTFGDDELTGIWVGKFEISSNVPETENGGGPSNTLTARIKPNVYSWKYNSLSNFFKVIQNMQKSNNEYGLNTDKTKVDSHMIKNMEWGAVAYLTNSYYGRCSNNKCDEVDINSYFSNNDRITGCGPQSKGSLEIANVCNSYTTSLGQLASTTSNVYGIYDMNGANYEYVMGNMSKVSGSYQYNTSGSGAGYGFSYSEDTKKYIDTYAYGTSNRDQNAYNRFRLGDAMAEIILVENNGGGAWYGDYTNNIYSEVPWVSRGGQNEPSAATSRLGIFYTYAVSGYNSSSASTRAILVSIN